MANTKLLLVEDDENLAYMEKSCFEDIIGGYEVKTAVNGKEGLKVWQDFQPDVIVSDIDMHIMDGIEMVKKIREVDGKNHNSVYHRTHLAERPEGRLCRRGQQLCEEAVYSGRA